MRMKTRSTDPLKKVRNRKIKKCNENFLRNAAMLFGAAALILIIIVSAVRSQNNQNTPAGLGDENAAGRAEQKELSGALVPGGGGTEADDSPLMSGSKIKVYDKTAGNIKEMYLEQYIACAAAGEMPAAFDSEAIKAQAVAARTYAYRRMQGSGCSSAGGADICTSSAHCQAFLSVDEMKERWGERFDEYYTKIIDVVVKTRGQIVTYQGKPIDALYFSSSGGKTENAQNVYGNSLPYLVSVDGMDEEASREEAGKVKVSYAEALEKFDKLTGGTGLAADELKFSVSIEKRNDSGRVETVKAGGKNISGLKIRKAFGLKSTNFTMSFGDNYMVFETTGYGHGVGMSQYGANEMAKDGASYRQILEHFYTGIEIESIE